MFYVDVRHLPILLFFAGAFLCRSAGSYELARLLQESRAQARDLSDSGKPVEVEVDRKSAFWTALRGQEHSRLQSCTRWPEKGDCGQECLEQINPSPENIERLLTKWYEGKSCAICTRALSPSDWRRSRLALLNEQHKLFELRDMYLEELQQTLQNMRPLCWNCHQEERTRQAVPQRVLKGDRQGLNPAIE